ncbi:hypothetical protein B0H16DRAFT_1830349, partial [Mycena metata]
LFDLMRDLDWTLGDFLHHTFTHQDADKNHIPRSQRHGNIVQRFLSGSTNHNVAEIVHSWLTSPDGRGVRDADMFDVETPYLELKPVRLALTAFAAQTCATYLGAEAREMVKKSSGLHAHSIQRLAFHFMKIIAEPVPRSRKGVIVVRKSRPRDNIVAHCLSTLAFCKNDEARLLPLARGILYLSSLVPADIISYNSRVAGTPSINTITRTLKGFSDQKAIVIRRRGRDVSTFKGPNGRLYTKAKAIIFDNVQHYFRQHDLRIGRENEMIIGIACTFFEFDVDLAALDVLDKRFRIANSRRAQLTVEELLSMIDQAHMKRVGTLQFIEALSNHIPEAAGYKTMIHIRYRTTLCKLQVPVVKYPISPLATSGKNETYLAELKEAFIDFLGQLGMTEDDFDFRLLFGGGDGMSYNNMLLLQRFLQNHVDNPLQSFELLRPVLQIWHTLWTDLCRIHETHWGAPLNDNPATLGHSAKKIGRAAPANLKKVDYYPSAQLLNLVHDMRMLDCWAVHFGTEDIFEYFAALGRIDKLPPFEELEEAAKKLFETYVASGARFQVGLDARDAATEWTARAPIGTVWDPLPPSSNSAQTKRKSKKVPSPKIPKRTVKKAPLPPPFFGDQVLFDTGTFMHDAMVFREAAAATAQGDVGRVWEALKIMVITFAGSTHSKYMNYLLEMIADIELESNPFLKDAQLMSMVLNPDGEPGDFKACDIYQELLNRCIDPIVQRKDADYGSNHVRNVWSRNIKDIYELKTEFRSGLDLKKRSGKHKKPHERPEIKTLLPLYRDLELHKRRPGRTYDDGRNWQTRTSNARLTHLQGNGTAPREESEHESDWSDESDEENMPPMTMGDIFYRDGELVVHVQEEGDNDED